MAKPRTDFGSWGDGRIDQGIARGESAETVAAALTAAGVKGATTRTIGRRMSERRGGAPVEAPSFAAGLASAGGAPSDPPAPPESAGGLPDVPTAEELAATDDERLDRILEDAARARTRAVAEGNFTAIGAMGRLAKDVMAEKRRRAPPVVPDPNDAPDIVAARERGIAMFDALIAQAVGE